MSREAMQRSLLWYPGESRAALCSMYPCSLLPLRLGNNLSGQYKRGVGMALQIGIGNFSGAMASNIYRTRDEPRFILGRE